MAFYLSLTRGSYNVEKIKNHNAGSFCKAYSWIEVAYTLKNQSTFKEFGKLKLYIHIYGGNRMLIIH
jgi:hypothetical protein